MILEVFNGKIFVTKCNDETLYKNKQLRKTTERIFSLPEVLNRTRGGEWDSRYGQGETTENNPLLGPANIPDAQPLMQWITNQSLLAYKEMFGEDVTRVNVKKSWMNQMFDKSQGLCHNHVGFQYDKTKDYNGHTDLNAIFYVNNPENGSDLIFIRNGQTGLKHSSFLEEDKFYVKPRSGDLVIHTPELWHAVGEHNSKETRLCFVFHLTFE